MPKSVGMALPARTLRGTLAIGPSVAAYVGEAFPIRVRGEAPAVVLALVEGGALQCRALGSLPAEEREVCLASITGGDVEPVGAGRAKLAVLYLDPLSHFGRVAALHAQPRYAALRPGVVDALRTIPFPRDDASDLPRAALGWLAVLGVPEAKGLLDEDVQEELADYDAYVDEEGMPLGLAGFSRDVVKKLDRLGAGARLGLPWLRNRGALRAMYSGEDREVTETRLGAHAVKGADIFMRRSLGFGVVWPERVISLVGANRT
jgi:hypothetical protein